MKTIFGTTNKRKIDNLLNIINSNQLNVEVLNGEPVIYTADMQILN